VKPAATGTVFRRVLAHVRARPGRTVIVVAILAYAFGGGFIFGGLGSHRAAASAEYEYSTTITTTTTTSTSTSTTTTTTPTITKPGKGCGDKNHLHDRRFECKVVINDASVKEGKAGTTTTLVFTVSLSGQPDSPVTVDYATANGTATAGSDYLPTSGTLGFPVGVSTRTITVTVIGDGFQEPSETFALNLSNPSANAYLGDSQGLGTIAAS
jgi:Calx-beta domain